jgi:hypothetical protein
MSVPEFPSEIVTNTDTRAVILTPEIEAALPGVDRAFAEVDKAFLEDPEKYLENLEASLFTFPSNSGSGDVACSLIHGSSSKADELLVIFAPFSDRSPRSSARELYSFITADASGGIISKEKAAPNTWNQTTKSAVVYELLKALGNDLPVLTIYSPVPTTAYNSLHKELIRKGNFRPSAHIARQAIFEAQQRINGLSTETSIDKVHLHGASLGASNALGAAQRLKSLDHVNVRTVTAQELILGPRNLIDLGKRFTVSQQVGEPSDETVPEVTPRIEEPTIRKTVDRHGPEPSTYARVIKAMKPTYMLGLTKSGRTAELIEELLDLDVELLVALAENSSLTHQTASYLPNSGEKLVTIKGEQGQKIGHLVDEHVALTGLVTVLNIVNAQS